MSEQLLPLHCRVCHAARACDAGQDSCCSQCQSACNGCQVCGDGVPFPSLVTRAHMLPGCELTQAERDLSCLITVPASDMNFKGALERADRDTIKAALAAIEGKPETKTKELALRRRLKTFLQEKLDTISGTNQRQDRALALNMGELEAERERQQQEKEEQVDREQRIAQVHQVIGRVQANMLMSKFADVGSLVWMKEIKEAKLYRDLPGVGTWDNFCKTIGLSRQKVDEDLQNLSIFGEEFLLMGRRFSLGYQDLRKLRQLAHDGTVTIEGECIRIGEEAIPINEDHADELQAAIEQIITAKDEITKRVDKLEKDFKGALKEETKGLHSEIKAYKERVKTLELYEPKEHDREWSVKQMAVVEEAAGAFQIAVSKFVADPRLKEDRHLQALVSGHLHEAEMALHDARARLDEVIDMFND